MDPALCIILVKKTQFHFRFLAVHVVPVNSATDSQDHSEATLTRIASGTRETKDHGEGQTNAKIKLTFVNLESDSGLSANTFST